MARLGMALYAVWVALALVSQDSTPCPTHDGPGAAAVAMAMMPSMMHMDVRGGTHASSNGSSHAAHHSCRCLGCGCCVAALDLRTPSTSLVPAPSIVLRVALVPGAVTRVDRPHVDRRLPFANAPPVMVSRAV